jgi:hypothetical protein
MFPGIPLPVTRFLHRVRFGFLRATALSMLFSHDTLLPVALVSHISKKYILVAIITMLSGIRHVFRRPMVGTMIVPAAGNNHQQSAAGAGAPASTSMLAYTATPSDTPSDTFSVKTKRLWCSLLEGHIDVRGKSFSNNLVKSLYYGIIILITPLLCTSSSNHTRTLKSSF